jgi:hypothetical protein
MRRLALAGFLLLGSVFTPLAAFAQDCDINLTDSIIALTQAQANATSGDTAAALSAITGVQATLDTIREGCPLTAETTFDLSETFTAPDDLFSFNYPAGWFEAEYHDGMDWEQMLASSNPLFLAISAGGTMTVLSEEMPPGYSAYAVIDGVQSVTVIVGSPMHLFTELGIYDTDLAEDFLAGRFDKEDLVNALETRIQQSPMASNLEIAQVEAERPTISVETEGADTRLTLLLVELDPYESRYALLVSPTSVEDDADMLPLLLAMAETVQ